MPLSNKLWVPSNPVHSRSPKGNKNDFDKIKKFWGAQTQFIHGALRDKYVIPEKTSIFCGPQTKFIHGTLKDKYLILEIIKRQHGMKHSKYMN